LNDDEHSPTIPDPSLRAGDAALRNRDVAKLRDSVKKLASEDTFGGRFTLIGEAGSGGMGIVYEAKDRESERRVAIKVITGLPSPTERARFAAEAEVLERLDHPAIVDYVDHGLTATGEPYIAMEWLVGESLSRRLDRGRLTVAETAILGERIADALEHAHASGVVHRDLKPSNIFLVDGKLEEAHLIDFGVAKHGDKDLTHTGQMIGTPGYMAPEQVRGEKSVGARADLFALGCVLYKGLTGRDAFEGQEVMEVLARLLLEDPPPVESLAPDVPPRLSHLIGSLLSKDPTRRVGEASIVAAELRAIRAAIAANNTRELELKPEQVPTPISLAKMRARTPLWIIALAGGGLLVAIVTLVLLFARGSDAPAPPSSLAAQCEKGDAAACYRHARDLHDNKKDHEGGRAADGRACSLGNDDGCYGRADSLIKLAKPYAPTDERRIGWLAEAEKLLNEACAREHWDSCRELGKQVSASVRPNGDRVGTFTPDPSRSFTLVVNACTHDNVKACEALVAMIKDKSNGGTPEMRANAQQARKAACTRLAQLHCED
jgi:hypothetical protein